MFAVILLLISISLTWATDQTIILRLGAGSTLLLERPFKTVLIEDPNVVDVITQSDRSVILQPLNLGATNVVFIDEKSIAITNMRILVFETSASRINCQGRERICLIPCEEYDDLKRAIADCFKVAWR
jgi:Flp pilus assembly secretin CpaC